MTVAYGPNRLRRLARPNCAVATTLPRDELPDAATALQGWYDNFSVARWNFDRAIDGHRCVRRHRFKGTGAMSQDDHSTLIQGCIDRLRLGDPAALNELLDHASERLTRLTRIMLRDFPGVHRWEQTDDVLQNAVVRLCRALGEVRPPTAADFFRLAAAQIRRELIDLARRYSGAHGLAPHQANAAAGGTSMAEPAAGAEPADTTNDPDRLAAWTDFHREVEALPAEEREAFDLLFYQGLSQAEASALLEVSERTIKRRWQAGATTAGRDPGRDDAWPLTLIATERYTYESPPPTAPTPDWRSYCCAGRSSTSRV